MAHVLRIYAAINYLINQGNIENQKRYARISAMRKTYAGFLIFSFDSLQFLLLDACQVRLSALFGCPS